MFADWKRSGDFVASWVLEKVHGSYLLVRMKLAECLS